MDVKEIQENAPKHATHYNVNCKPAPYERHTKTKKYQWYQGKWHWFNCSTSAIKLKELTNG